MLKCLFLIFAVAEIIKAWSVLATPKQALAQMLLLLAAFLGLGIFPWVDNFAHLGGFCCGLVMAEVLLPRISQDWRDNLWTIKRAWPLLALAGLFAVLLCIFLLYPEDFCSWCHYFSCVPVARRSKSESNVFFNGLWGFQRFNLGFQIY